MSKIMKKILSLMICLTMCVNFALPAIAANNSGITFSATLNNSTLSVSDQMQTVVMTIATDAEVLLDGLGFTTQWPEGWTIQSITGGQKLGSYDSTATNLNNGKAYWKSSDSENVTGVTTLAVITFEIPANTPAGKYTLGITGLEITSDYGEVWEDSASASTTLEIKAPAEKTNYEIYYTLNSDEKGTNTGYKAYGVEDEVVATVYLVNTGDAAINLQAYDIYLTYDPALKYKEHKMTGAVAYAAGKDIAFDEGDTIMQHIQAVADDFTAVELAPNAPVTLGTITFSIDGDTAVYGTAMPITLTQGNGAVEEGAKVTNIAVGGETEGDKQSHYPKVTQKVTVEGEEITFSGAEVNTTYTVTFDANITGETVTGMPTNNKSVKQHNVAMDLPTLSCPSDNYDFLGWSTDKTATTAQYTTTLPASVNDENGTTLYAVWSANTHTVTWMNYDSSEFKTTQVIHGQKPTDPGTPTYTKEGYTSEFKGWATSEKQSSGSAVAYLPEVTANVDYYAAFTFDPITYTIVFNGNGATDGSTDSIEATYDGTYNLTPNGFEKTGHTFMGWNTQANGEGVGYSVGQQVSNLTTINGDTFTLYAQWEANKYDVTYDVGGTQTKVEDVKYNTAIELMTPADKTGYTFDGWYNGEKNVGKAGENYTVTGDVTLTAKYIANKYHVEFDLNGVTINEVAPAKIENAEYDKTEITMPTITAAGKTFAGWKHGEEVYTAGSKNMNLTTENGATVTLVAQWTTNSWQVFSDDTVQNGTVTAKNQVEESGTSANMCDTIVVTLTPATGYQMADGSLKYIATDDKGNPIEGAQYQDITTMGDSNYIFEMPDSHVKVTAAFEQIDYKATVGTVEYGEVTLGDNWQNEVTAHYQDTVTVNVVPATGYEIEKVFYTVNGEEKAITATDDIYSFAMPDGNVTVSAIFKKKSITLTFVSDGETYTTVTGEYESTVTAPTDPVKEGHTFTGWSPELPKTMPAENATYTAQWTINSYEVKFLKDEDGEEVSSATVKYGATITVPTDPTKTGYTFTGWSPEVPETMPAAAQTFIAQWTARKVSITLNAGDGKFTEVEGTPSTQTVERAFGTTYGKLDEPERGGYTFGGWQDGTTNITAETVVDKEGPVTLTAKWTANEYTVTFDSANGETATTAKFKTDTGFTTLPAPTKTGYIFDGWLVTETQGNWPVDSKYNAGSSASNYYGDVTLTAQWKQAASYVVENYLYARSDYRMLRVSAAGVSENEEYQFNGKPMYYTTDANYLVNTNDTGVFYTLIEAKYVEGNKLNATGYELLQPVDRAEGKDRATIEYNGDINDDKVVNVADANIVYQMVQQESGNYYSETQLEVWQRLAADMHKEPYQDGAYRGNAEDVDAIVKLINTTNP